MAGESQFSRLLLGIGLRDFSMHPSQLLQVKQRVLQSDVSLGAALVERIRRTDEPSKLTALIQRLNA
jgi:phosphotransferase system enzyme I (PtsI)